MAEQATLNHGHRLYHAALAADDAYSAVIREQTGGKRTRWTLTQDDSSNLAIRLAYQAKRRADAAWSAYQRWAR